MTDPYGELGVPRDADPETIRAAYRKLSSEHHPDRGGDRERMAAINQAVAILSEPDRRAKFDRTGDAGTASSTEHQARELLYSLVQQVILNAPEFHDVIEVTRGLVGGQIAEAKKKRVEFQEKLDRIEKRAGRIKGGDLFSPLLEQLADQHRAGVAACDAHVELCKLALSMVEGYAYELDLGITMGLRL